MRRFIVVIAVAALVAGPVASSVAGAAGKDAHGWWWRPQGGLLGTAIPPPGVPEDGLAVEATPDGPNAIAALRYVLDSGETQPVLVLKVAEQQGEPTIQACVSTQSWKGAHGGPWDERPTYDCGGAVAGEPSEDAKTWQWKLEPLLRKRRLDVVLVPDPGVARVTFAAPDDAALQTRSQSAGGSGFDPPPVSDFTDSSSGSPDGAPRSAQDFSGSSSLAQPGSGGAVGGTAQAPAEAEDDPSAPLAPLAAGPAASEPAAAPETLPASSDFSRTTGAIIAAMAAVFALGLWHQDTSGPRRAAPAQSGVVAGHVGGLGRFARPRSGSAPPLL